MNDTDLQSSAFPRFTSPIGVLLLMLGLLFEPTALSQNPLSTALKETFSNMTATKQRAAEGDVKAQVSLADSLVGAMRFAEALGWYRKAAAQGSLEATYRVGAMLLHGKPGSADQKVEADPAEGIRWIYRSATNRYAGAYETMARACRDGTGVAKDMIQAYAWMRLHAETSQFGRAQLNQLSLTMDLAATQEGERLATDYKAGRWPKLAPVVISKDTFLKLSGIAPGANPTAVINGKVVAHGETVTISDKTKQFKVKCLKVEKDAVLVLVEGEAEPRLLQLK